MLWQMLRFNKLCTQMATAPAGRARNEAQLAQPLGEFLKANGFNDAFTQWYLLPMLGCIWSCPTDQMLQFPVSTMVRFCYNHGLIQITKRPQWYTVAGGARHYVDKITEQIADKRLNTPVELIQRDDDGVRLITDGRVERFDKVVIATHAPQALNLLRDASQDERRILGAFRTQPNRAVLHTDASVLPSQRSAWAAWNYVRGDAGQESGNVCLHYLINKLQPIPFEQPIIVSLNPSRPIARHCILGEFKYAHPVFDAPATAAQQLLPGLQGVRDTYFCGAWTSYGFHEDGLKSGLAVARTLLQSLHAADKVVA
jgi:uncharacterized protein